jgi:hypothetical protein
LGVFKQLVFVIALGAFAVPGSVFAAGSKATRSPASSSKTALRTGTQSVDRALDVKGQSRNWNRLSGVHRDREAIDFVQTRTDYRAEIENTRF